MITIENRYNNMYKIQNRLFGNTEKRLFQKNEKFQSENSESLAVSEISDVLHRVFPLSSNRFCPIAKMENSDLKNVEKISEISKTTEVSEFST